MDSWNLERAAGLADMKTLEYDRDKSETKKFHSSILIQILQES